MRTALGHTEGHASKAQAGHVYPRATQLYVLHHTTLTDNHFANNNTLAPDDGQPVG
jgi:hypothetical protein